MPWYYHASFLLQLASNNYLLLHNLALQSFICFFVLMRTLICIPCFCCYLVTFSHFLPQKDWYRSGRQPLKAGFLNIDTIIQGRSSLAAVRASIEAGIWGLAWLQLCLHTSSFGSAFFDSMPSNTQSLKPLSLHFWLLVSKIKPCISRPAFWFQAWKRRVGVALLSKVRLGAGHNEAPI